MELAGPWAPRLPKPLPVKELMFLLQGDQNLL